MKVKQYPNKFNPDRENITRFFGGESVGRRVTIRTKSGRVKIVTKRQYVHMKASRHANH